MASESAKPDTQASTATTAPPSDRKQESTKPAALGEDDEFEDFPVDDWPEDQTEAAAQQQTGGESSKHLWEESWDDDDTTDDFSQQLREELKKVEASKRR